MSKSTPKDVFLHLLIVITLYISVFALIALVFQYINYSWPDQLQYTLTGVFDAIRQTIASVIIAWPLFVLLTWLVHKEVNQEPAKREVKVGKWLTYLTLLISAVTIIVQLIRLVYNFLGGELTLAFSLKLLTILLVAAAVFGYYFWDLRRDLATTKKTVKTITWTTSLIILVTIIAGFFIVGSPASQRARRFDETRISNLQNIQNEIVVYWQQKNTLPQNLEALTNDISGFIAPSDPETKQPYEYTVKGQWQFELCATFKTPSLNKLSTNKFTQNPASLYQQNWQYSPGRQCFSRTIDPERDRLPAEKTTTATPTN